MVIEPELPTPAPDTLVECRATIDAIDDAVFALLERRVALVRSAQRTKHMASLPCRDPGREREMTERIAAHAPGFGEARVERLIRVIIDECLDAATAASGPPGPGITPR